VIKLQRTDSGSENTQQLIDELTGRLDEVIALLADRIDQLKRLGPSMARRDQQSTEAILDEIEITQNTQEQTDLALGYVRHKLGVVLGIEKTQLKLSGLIKILSPDNAEIIRVRREKIIELAEVLRLENLKAAVVLSECAHMNHLLMQSLMPRNSEVTTYGSSGAESWQSGPSLVDAKG